MADEIKIADVPGAAPAAPDAAVVLPVAPVAPPAANAAPPAPPAPPQAPPAPLQGLPPMDAPGKGDPDTIAAAKGDLQDAQAELLQMDKWLERAAVERAKLAAAVEVAQNALDKVQPIQTNHDAIQAYLAQQRALLQARGEQNRNLAEAAKAAGLSVQQYLAHLLPGKRAPIDAAMARRNTRGMSRPGAVKKG